MSASSKIAVNAVRTQKENTYPISLEQQKLYAAKKNPEYEFGFNNEGFWVNTTVGNFTNEVLLDRVVSDFNRGVIYGTRYPAIAHAKEMNKKIQKILDEKRDLGMLQYKQNREQQGVTQAQIDKLQAELIALNDESIRLDEERKSSNQVESTSVTAEELLEGELGLTSEQALSYARSMQQSLLYYHRYLTNYRGEPEFSAEVCREDDKLVIKLHTETDPELYSEFEMLVSDLQVDAEGKPKVAPIRLVDTRVITTDLKVLIPFYAMENFISEKEFEEKIAIMKNEDELEQFWFFLASLDTAVTGKLMPMEKLKAHFLNFRPVQQPQNLQAPNLKTVLLCLEQIDTTDEKAVFAFIKDTLAPYVVDAMKRKAGSEQEQTLLSFLLADAKAQDLGRIRPALMQSIKQVMNVYEDNVVTLTPEGQYLLRLNSQGLPVASFLRELQNLSFRYGRDECGALPGFFSDIVASSTDAVVSIEDLKQKTTNMSEEELEEFEIFLEVFSEKFNKDLNFDKNLKDFPTRFPGDTQAFTTARDAHEKEVRDRYKEIFRLRSEVNVAVDASFGKVNAELKQRQENIEQASRLLTPLYKNHKELKEQLQAEQKKTRIPKILAGVGGALLFAVGVAVAVLLTGGLALIPIIIFGGFAGAAGASTGVTAVDAISSERKIKAELRRIDKQIADIKGSEACKENPYIACGTEELQRNWASVSGLCKIEADIENKRAEKRKSKVDVESEERSVAEAHVDFDAGDVPPAKLISQETILVDPLSHNDGEESEIKLPEAVGKPSDLPKPDKSLDPVVVSPGNADPRGEIQPSISSESLPTKKETKSLDSIFTFLSASFGQADTEKRGKIRKTIHSNLEHSESISTSTTILPSSPRSRPVSDIVVASSNIYSIHHPPVTQKDDGVYSEQKLVF